MDSLRSAMGTVVVVLLIFVCGAPVVVGLSVVGQLPQALSDCNESLRLRPYNTDTLGNRGFDYLKLGQFDRAIADYDAALNGDSKDASSLYGRGLAKLKKGNTTEGEADIAAARAIQADIVEEFARYGVK